jgi:hypothetical protein
LRNGHWRPSWIAIAGRSFALYQSARERANEGLACCASESTRIAH